METAVPAALLVQSAQAPAASATGPNFSRCHKLLLVGAEELRGQVQQHCRAAGPGGALSPFRKVSNTSNEPCEATVNHGCGFFQAPNGCYHSPLSERLRKLLGLLHPRASPVGAGFGTRRSVEFIL